MSTLVHHPDVAAPVVVPTTADAATGAGTVAESAPAPAARAARALPVLAPLLPALLLIGLGIAGLSDPPAPPADGSGEVVSRLHVPAEPPLRRALDR